MIKLFIPFFLFSFIWASAQPPGIEWQKSLGGTNVDAATSVRQTTDGGYIITGYTQSRYGDVSHNNGSADYWVVKLNNRGVIEWQKCLGGSQADIGQAVQQTRDGGYIVAGWANSANGDVTGKPRIGEDCWIVKLNSSGTIQWQKSLGGYHGDAAFYIQPTREKDQGYIMAGSSQSNNEDVSGNHNVPPLRDFWVVKLNSSAGISWQKCLGGTGDDVAKCIQQTSDGGYIVAGTSHSADGDVTGNHGNADYWIVKLTNTGTIVWQKSLGGSQNDESFFIQQCSDGGYIVAGSTYSNDGDVSGNHSVSSDSWIVKLNSTGNIQWQKCLGGSGVEEARSIQETTDGGFIVAGSTTSNNGDVTGYNGGWDYWIVKLNSSGNIQWQKCLGGTNPDAATSVRQTTDKGFIIAGYSNSTDGDVTGHHGTNNNNADFWIVKLIPPPVADVWMKDTPNDTGLEPDPATALQTMSASPYIWVRNTRDINFTNQHMHEDPVFGSTSPDHWVYVKLHNSFNTVTNGSLELYYASTNSGLRWPAAWHLISSIPVTGFAANSTTIIDFNWTSLPGVGQYSLLARWVAATDPMTIRETTDINANARGNNNIVYRNINIVALQ